MSEPLFAPPAAARDGVWLTVNFRVKPERVDEAREVFARHVHDGRGDRGNLLFFAVQERDDPTRFTTVEAWADQGAIDDHDATEHHARFLKRLDEILAEEKTVTFCDYREAADRGN